MLDKNPKSAIWPSLGVAGHSFAFYAVCVLLVLSLVSRGSLAADAIALYGTFIAAAYLSPFLGSWLSLRLGLRVTVMLGAVLAAVGVCGLVLASGASSVAGGLNTARPSLGAGHVWLDWGLSGGLGCLALGVGLVAARLGPVVSPLWLVSSIVLSTLSELAVSIGGLSRVAKVTPRRYMPLAMSCWYATVALGGLIAGQAGRLPLLSSFMLCSALSACAALVYLSPSVVAALRSALVGSVRASGSVRSAPRPVSVVAAL